MKNKLALSFAVLLMSSVCYGAANKSLPPGPQRICSTPTFGSPLEKTSPTFEIESLVESDKSGGGPKTRHCEGFLEDDIFQHPDLQPLLEEIQTHCPSSCRPMVYCLECSSSNSNADDATTHYSLDGCPFITFCKNCEGSASKDIRRQLLKHELTHVKQLCQHGIPNPFYMCSESICMEYEAYDESGSCMPPPLLDDGVTRQSRESCLCLDACRSSGRICGSADSCFDKCKKIIGKGQCKDGHFNR